MPIRPEGARQAKLGPKWRDGAFIGIRDRSDEMLIMTPSGVYKTRNVRRRPELERWDLKFLTTLKGTPWNPNPAAGEMAADALPADMAIPMPARTSLSGRGGGGTGGPCSEHVVHQEIRCAEKWLQHELSCRPRLENCLAEDEETKF